MNEAMDSRTHGTGIAVINEYPDFVAELESTTTQMFCTFDAKTKEERAVLFKGMNDPDVRLADIVNEEICIKDVYAETIRLTNEETGESTVAPRIVLFGCDGTSYQCVSLGVMSALKKLFMVYGMPTWENGINVKVKSINKGQKRVLTLTI